MKYQILALLLIFFVSFGYTQNKENRNGNLIGYIQKDDLLKGKFKIWFEKEYNHYTPSKRIVKRMAKNLEGISVICFAGTWCHDSKHEIPKFFKIMEEAEFDIQKNFKLIGISRGKKTPNNLEKGYNINRTPTFIFYKNGEEIARYVEHARETMEKDFLKIVLEKEYKHSYQN